MEAKKPAELKPEARAPGGPEAAPQALALTGAARLQAVGVDAWVRDLPFIYLPVPHRDARWPWTKVRGMLEGLPYYPILRFILPRMRGWCPGGCGRLTGYRERDDTQYEYCCVTCQSRHRGDGEVFDWVGNGHGRICDNLYQVHRLPRSWSRRRQKKDHRLGPICSSARAVFDILQ